MPKQDSSSSSKKLPNGNSGVYGVLVGITLVANIVAIVLVWVELSNNYQIF